MTERSELLDALRPLEILRDLSAQELEAVAAASAWLSLRDGEAVATAGRLFAVGEGEVLITRPGAEGREIVLATFVAGDSFGELGLFGADGGGSAARCEGPVRLLQFPAQAAEDRPEGGAAAFFAAHPGIAAKMLHALLGVMASRIRSTNRLIAEKSPWVQELRHQVLVDKLTGLYNATWLEEDFASSLAGKGASACMLMIKPDNFKVVNDTCGGHHAGDRVLQLMAGELRVLLGEEGVPVRYRGDVLAAALPGLSLRRARELAEQARLRLRALDLSEVGPVRITVSVGVASYNPRGIRAGGAAAAGAAPAGAAAASGLVERAYANLFVARNAGGDRVRSVFRPAAGSGA